MSEIILGFVILLLFIYIAYQDISNRREREKLQLKLMSKNVEEYTSALHAVKSIQEEKPKNSKEEKEEYQEIDDVPLETLLGAKDLT